MMISVNKIKQNILDLALRGSLIKQNETDTDSLTTINTILKIQAELKRTDKRIKYLETLPIGDDVPYNLPQKWSWIRIGQIEEINLGFTYRPEYVQEGVYFLSVKDITGGIIDFNSAKKVSVKTYEEASYGSKPKKGDILFGRVCTMGKPQIIQTDEPFCIFVSLGFFRDHTNIVNKKYICYWMESKLFDRQVDLNVGGVCQKNLNTGWLKNFYIPFPPIEEQERIVAKLDEIFAELDKIDENQTRLANIQEKIEAKLLKLAIQGKLVEQRPEEGTGEELFKLIQQEKQDLIKAGKIKKEKPLSAIEEDEVPFEIPSTWKWVRMNDVLDVRDGTHDSPKYYSEGVPFVTSKNLINGDIDFSNTKLISFDDARKINERSYVENDDILMAMIGTIGNPVIVKKDRDFCIKNVALIKNFCKGEMFTKYLYYFLKFSESNLIYIAKASVQQFISLSIIRNYIIPLPPFEEQKRIVAKIEELLPLCKG